MMDAKSTAECVSRCRHLMQLMLSITGNQSLTVVKSTGDKRAVTEVVFQWQLRFIERNNTEKVDRMLSALTEDRKESVDCLNYRTIYILYQVICRRIVFDDKYLRYVALQPYLHRSFSFSGVFIFL